MHKHVPVMAVTFTSYSSSVKGHESSPCYTVVCFEQNMGIFKLSSVTKIESNLAPLNHQAVTDVFLIAFGQILRNLRLGYNLEIN